MAKEPENALYYAEEGSIYLRKQELEKAQASLEKSISLQPDFVAGYRLLGLCLVRQHNDASAPEPKKSMYNCTFPGVPAAPGDAAKIPRGNIVTQSEMINSNEQNFLLIIPFSSPLLINILLVGFFSAGKVIRSFGGTSF